MIYIRTGSQALTLLKIMSVVGEFPTGSMHLLGNERVYKALIRKMTTRQTYRLPQTDTEITGRMLSVLGKGRSKTIRLYNRTALPILTLLGAEEYYRDAYIKNNLSSNTSHRERNHRVAETVAMCMRAGMEYRPYALPTLQNEQLLTVVPKSPSFYLAKSLKQIGQIEQKKTMFTRLTGAIFTPGTVMAVYNTRDATMKWNGMGEFKAKHSLLEVARMNAGVSELNSAILLGQSDSVAMNTLLESDGTRRMEFRFDSIYRHVHFVPMNHFGIQLLRFLCVPDWNEKLMSLLFEPEVRSYNRGMFEYDALIEGRYVFSYLGSDLARLIRFREATRHQTGQFEVLCFPEQAPFLQEYLGKRIGIKTIDMALVDSKLCPERLTIKSQAPK